VDREGDEESDGGDAPGPDAGLSKASGIMVSATIVRIAPAATAVMTARVCGDASPSAT
jgi:hypothetical protein